MSLSLQSMEARLKLTPRASSVLRARLCRGLSLHAIALQERITREQLYVLLVREVRRCRKVLRPWKSVLQQATDGGEDLAFLLGFFSELRLDDPMAPDPDPRAAILAAVREVTLCHNHLIAFVRGKPWEIFRRSVKLASFGVLAHCNVEIVSEHIAALITERKLLRLPKTGGHVLVVPEQAHEVARKFRRAYPAAEARLTFTGGDFFGRRVA